MNAMYVTPSVPKTGKTISVCYEWDPPTPGAVVTIDVAYAPNDDGNETLGPLVCPAVGGMACALTNPVPTGKTGVTFTDSTGQAPQESRVVA